MAGKALRSRIGMFSRSAAIRNVDGRTAEARLVRQTIADLTDHLGGNPTVPQQLLIHATSVIVFRIRACLDRYTAKEGDVAGLDKHLVALQNSLRLNLLALGLERPVDQAPETLAVLLAKPGRKAA